VGWGETRVTGGGALDSPEPRIISGPVNVACSAASLRGV